MFIYFLVLLLPVYGFIPRVYYDYNKIIWAFEFIDENNLNALFGATS